MKIDNKLKNITKIISNIQKLAKTENKAVYVGIPKDSPNYPDGTSIQMVALSHEFGLGNVTEKAYLRSTVKQEQQAINNMFKKVAVDIINKKDVDINTLLASMGQHVSSSVQTRMSNNEFTTQKTKKQIEGGRNVGLIDTRLLFQSITYKVGE